ncbi:MAG: paaK [Ferruginibacter sp.]|nr:paaK [Ferruginibacter sp.]
MAVHFHKLKVSKIKKETADCVSISFDIPPELQQEFVFKEGQNITVKKEINGEEVRRSYSICAAPHENLLKVAVKAIEGGAFSMFANEVLKEGDELELLPPSGKFNAKLEAGKAGNFLAIAAGSGITPVISIIKHTLQQHPQNTFTLVYGNRSRASIIFFEELEALKNKFINRFNMVNILSRERTDSDINYGRIDRAKLQSLDKLLHYEAFDSIYICGPEQIIFAARDYLTDLGIGRNKIHFELFNTPGQDAERQQKVATETDLAAGPKSKITVKLDGRAFDFDLAQTGASILDAALQQGADLPFACKGGVCCTCRAKLVSGEVHMDVNYALEPEEVAAGFILTCQSHPRTENVEVDFDVK